ncbi:MAG: O-antigen ligase family protein [Promethearchaeota archaeon]
MAYYNYLTSFKIRNYTIAFALSITTSFLFIVESLFALSFLSASLLSFLLINHSFGFLLILLFTGGFPLAVLTRGTRPFLKSIGGINIAGIRLVFLVSILLLVLLNRKRTLKTMINFRLYTIFLIWTGITLLYSPAKIDGLRLFFKLLYPFLIFIFIRTEVDNNYKIKKSVLSILGGGFVILFLLPMFSNIQQNRIFAFKFFHPSPFSFYMYMLSIFSYVKWRILKKNFWLIIAIIFAIVSFLALTRITIFAFLSSTIIIEIFLNKKKAIILAVVLMVVIISTIYFYYPLKDRMFHNTDLNLSDLLSSPNEALKSINLSGREILWGYLWNDFISNSRINLFLGVGVGATSPYFKKLEEQYSIIGGVAHNEYLRLLVEIGVIGLILFLVANIKFLVDMFRKIKFYKDNSEIKILSYTAFSLIIGYLVIAITDNPLDYYANFSQYVFAFIALTYSAIDIRRSVAMQKLKLKSRI